MTVKIPEDAKRYAVPMSYLHQGTAFIAKTTGAVVSGVAAMDGHAVSANYGTRTGNTYYSENPDKNYINVWFDGVVYGKHPVDRDYQGNRLEINSGMYEKDNWSFYVDKATYDRYRQDLKWKPVTDEEKVREEKKAELLRRVDALKKELENL